MEKLWDELDGLALQLKKGKQDDWEKLIDYTLEIAVNDNSQELQNELEQ